MCCMPISSHHSKLVSLLVTTEIFQLGTDSTEWILSFLSLNYRYFVVSCCYVCCSVIHLLFLKASLYEVFVLSISARKRVLHSVCIIDKVSKFMGYISPTLFMRTLWCNNDRFTSPLNDYEADVPKRTLVSSPSCSISLLSY